MMDQYVCLGCGKRFSDSAARGYKCDNCYKLAERSKQRSMERARRRADDIGVANVRSLLLKGKRSR
jgi:DNA-directed RNA polymerase subunit RPC12/RpoP